MPLTRREFLKAWALAALAMPGLRWLPGARAAAMRSRRAAPLDPISIPKFVDPLVIPPVMTPVADGVYEIAVRQFQQQVLPTGMPQTTVFGYGKAGDPLPGNG